MVGCGDNPGLGSAAEATVQSNVSGRWRGLAGTLQVSDYGGDRVGLRVTGEIDLNDHGAWEQALRSVLDRPDDVHLDLTGLRFIDAHGTGMLVRMAGMLGDGRRLVLNDPPRCLRRVLQTLWPAGVPAIVIEGDPT